AGLRRSPLFCELRRRELAKVAALMGERGFAPGEHVVVEGERGAGFFVIQAGAAEVTVGGRRIRTLGPGDHFGEVALLLEIPRTATVTALDGLRCFTLSSWDFRRLVETNAAVSWRVMVGMARGLVAAQDVLTPSTSP
ncbi:MAG: cyclic nucleotide-binding domain-containing protein, partial [Pseudonocardia sp.]